MTDPFKTIEMLARERNEMLATVTRTQERITRYVEVARAAKAHVDAWTNGKPSESDRAYLALTQAIGSLELVEGAALQTPPTSIEPKLKKHLGHPSCSLAHASVGGWFLESECTCPSVHAEAAAACCGPVGRTDKYQGAWFGPCEDGKSHHVACDFAVRAIKMQSVCLELDHSYDYRHRHGQSAVGVAGISGVHSGHPDCPMTKGLPSGEWFGNCTCPQPQEKR
jgi:hypothetical protein